jgi:polar amino acid transport system permease protein
VADAKPRKRPGLYVSYAVMALIGAQFVNFLVFNERFEWPVVWEYLFAPVVLQGLLLTLILTVVAMSLGVVVGALIALARLSAIAPLRGFAAVWVSIFRSVPPLVQLLFWYNLAYLIPVMSIGIPFGPSFGEWSANDLITPFTAAVIGLTLYQSPYSAEVIRAGLVSVPKGQLDAARSVGYTPTQSFWRLRVPQAMRVIIPPMGNDLIRMVKGTSLVSVIALHELLGSVQTVYNRTFQVVPLLMVAVTWYLVIISILYVAQSRLERRFGRGY